MNSSQIEALDSEREVIIEIERIVAFIEGKENIFNILHDVKGTSHYAHVCAFCKSIQHIREQLNVVRKFVGEADAGSIAEAEKDNTELREYINSLEEQLAEARGLT